MRLEVVLTAVAKGDPIPVIIAKVEDTPKVPSKFVLERACGRIALGGADFTLFNELEAYPQLLNSHFIKACRPAMTTVGLTS